MDAVSAIQPETSILVPVSVVPCIPRNGYFKSRSLISNFMNVVASPFEQQLQQQKQQHEVKRRSRTSDDKKAEPEHHHQHKSGAPVLVSTDQTSFFFTPYSKELLQEIRLQQAFRVPLELAPHQQKKNFHVAPQNTTDNNSSSLQNDAEQQHDDVLQDQVSRILYLEKASLQFGGTKPLSFSATASTTKNHQKKRSQPSSSSSNNNYLSVLHPDLDPSILSCRGILDPCGLVVADSEWLRLQDNADDILCGSVAGHVPNNAQACATAAGFFGKTGVAPRDAPAALLRAIARWSTIWSLKTGNCDESLVKSVFGDRLCKRKKKMPVETAEATPSVAAPQQQMSGLQSGCNDKPPAAATEKKKPLSSTKFSFAGLTNQPSSSAAAASAAPNVSDDQNEEMMMFVGDEQLEAGKNIKDDDDEVEYEMFEEEAEEYEEKEDDDGQQPSRNEEDNDPFSRMVHQPATAPPAHQQKQQQMHQLSDSEEESPKKKERKPREKKEDKKKHHSLFKQGHHHHHHHHHHHCHAADNIDWHLNYYFYVTSRMCPNASCYIPLSEIICTVTRHVEEIKQRILSRHERRSQWDYDSSDDKDDTDDNETFNMKVARQLLSCKSVLQRTQKELSALGGELVRRRLIVAAEIFRYETHEARFRSDEANTRRCLALWGWYWAPEPLQPAQIFAEAENVRSMCARLFEDFMTDDEFYGAQPKMYTEASVLSPSSQLWPVLAATWRLPVEFLLARTEGEAAEALSSKCAGAGGGGNGSSAESLFNNSVYFSDSELVFTLLRECRDRRRSLTVDELKLLCGYAK